MPGFGENQLIHDKDTIDDGGYAKVLSLLTCGRNDNYQQDFRYRLTTCLNFLARNLARIGRLQDVEILVTDWGGEEPLSEVLSLSDDCTRICRFLYVPENVTREIRPDGGFSSVHALNVGIRRATGKFVAVIVADVLITDSSLRALFDVLEDKIRVPVNPSKTIFLLHRLLISKTITDLKPSIDEWDRYLKMNTGCILHSSSNSSPMFQRDHGMVLSPGNIYTHSTGEGCLLGANGYLMHSSIWKDCRGLNEEFIYWGLNDVEFGYRISQRYPWIDTFGLGVWTFHMDHSFGIDTSGRNTDKAPVAYQVNNTDWGLGGLDIETQIARVKHRTNPYLPALEDHIQSESGNSIAVLTPKQKRRVIKHAGWSTNTKSMSVDEWERLCVISWFSLNIRSRNYLQIGTENPSYAVAVAQACPIVEIYDLGFCCGSLKGIIEYARAPVEMGYQIYRRFVPGDPITAFKRLMESTDYSLNFDLVHANIDAMQDMAGTQLIDIAKFLRPKAAILLSATNQMALTATLIKIREAYPEFSIWICASGRTGIIEVLNNRRERLEIVNDKIDVVELDFGQPPLFLRGGRAKKFLVRLFRFVPPLERIMRGLLSKSRWMN